MRLIHLALPLAASALALAACGDSSSSTSSAASGGASSAASSGTDSATGSASSSGSASGTGSAVAASTCVSGALTASGSTALQPAVQKAATEYQAKCSGSTVTVSGGGSSTGLSNVAGGTSDLGMSDVPVCNAKSIDATTVTDHQVAIVLFAVVVNPKTNVSSLTAQQIQDVFSGKDNNWSQVGGANIPITLIERKPGSGTRLTFDKTVMAGIAESTSPASTQDSTSLVLQQVTGSDGGVSYLAASSAQGVTLVNIGAAKPTAADVASGTYKFFSHEHVYTKGAGSAGAQDFINYILGSAFQQEITTLGFLPVATTSQQSAVDAGC